MRLYEFEAKTVLAKVGVTMPKRVLARTPEEAEAAATTLGGPLVLKSQVLTGGRMKAGVPQANAQIAPEAVMDVAHVGSSMRYMASLPIDANVQFMTIMATKMPFIGRG